MHVLTAASCLSYVDSFPPNRRRHSTAPTLQCPNVPQGCINRKENFSVGVKLKKKKNPVLFYKMMKCHISANASHLPHPIISWCFVLWEIVCTHLPSAWLPLIIILCARALCFSHASVGCGIQKKAGRWRDKMGEWMSLLLRAISAKAKQTQRVKIILSGR